MESYSQRAVTEASKGTPATQNASRKSSRTKIWGGG